MKALTTRPRVDPPIDARDDLAPWRRIEVKLDEHNAILREILAELRGHRERSTTTLTRTDREALEKLLPAIAGAFGSELFLTSEALDHPSVRLVTTANTKSLGRLLKRAAGVPVAGYVVTHEAQEAHVAVWRIRQTIP